MTSITSFAHRRILSAGMVALMVAALIVSGVAKAPHADALAGDLDPTFGGTGMVTTAIGSPDQGRGVAILPDNRVVVVSTSGSDFGMAIFLPNGALDTSFSGDGKATFNIGGTDVAEAVAISIESVSGTPTPRVVIAGSSDGQIAAIKVRPESSDLDPGFGSSGVAKTTNLNSALGHDVVVRPEDGAVFVAGVTTSTGTGKDFAIVKFNSSGQLDATWGGSGVVITNNPLNTKDDEAFGITIQNTGNGAYKVVAAGSTDDGPLTGGSNINVAVARYTSNGTPDAGFFSDDGWSESENLIGATDVAYDVKVQPAADGSPPGKIVVAGFTQQPAAPKQFYIVRFTDNGGEDSSFDTDGKQVIDMAGGSDAGRNSTARGLEITANRKVVVVGSSRPDAATGYDFATAVLTPDGALDTLFSTDGKVITSLSAGNDEAYDAAIQPDGKIVAAGEVGALVGAVRYFGDPVAFLSAPSLTEGNGGNKSFTFAVTTSATSSQPFTLLFSTADGGPTPAMGCLGSNTDPNCDYITLTNEAVIVPAGQSSATINVQVRGDTRGEVDETFEGILTTGPSSFPATVSPTNGRAFSTIVNDDPANISISNASIGEGATGTTTDMSFTINHVPPNPAGVTTTVQFATADSSATTADADYIARTGSVEIGPGVSSVQVTASVVGDSKEEADEVFLMNLTSPSHNGDLNRVPVITDGQAEGSIVNDDGDLSTPRLVISDVSKQEGDSGTTTFGFNVTITASNATTVRVDFDTDDCTGNCEVTGTASPPVDYVANHGQVSFPPGTGARSQLINVTVNGDTVKEFDEVFKVILSDPQNAVIQDPEGRGEIRDDDGGGGRPCDIGDFFAYGSEFSGGVYVATGNIDGDDCADIITGAGPGGGPHVRVFSGRDGSELTGFFAYDPSFTGGVRVGAGDVDADGRDDIITAAGPGGGPHVKVFSGTTGSEIRSFFAYDPSFTGGVFVAAGRIDADGNAEIITGADRGGGPHVRIFSGANGSEIRGFFAYGQEFTGGVRLAAGDVDADGRADIITGAGPGGGPHVRVFSGVTGGEITGFFAYGSNFTGGVFVGSGQIDSDSRADIVTGADAGGGSHVRAFSGADLSSLADFFAYGSSFTGGVRVASGDADGDGFDDIICAPGRGGGPHIRVVT